MKRSLRILAVTGIGISLASFAPDRADSPALLALLDPGRIAGNTCDGQRNGASLMQRLLVSTAVAAPASAGRTIPLYDDLTRSGFTIASRDPQAQRYFRQGLTLAYGFNHAGAVRSFREAQWLDPDCAMCWWGEALALGPNINAPMDDRDRGAALMAMDRAMALRGNATPVERALIEAVAQRYSRDPAADRASLDATYADAMIGVAKQFPAHDDVAVLAAEAAMDTTPWNYWQADRKTPIGRSGEAVRLIETVIARNPQHAQAAHLYIHLLEASDPKRAETAADRLNGPLVPGAGHLVHMPGHIYQVLGRQADSIRTNVAAARADEAYIRDAGDNGLVRYGYYPHNVHFIVTSAQMAGDMGTAIREAKRLRTLLDTETSVRIAWLQAVDAAPYFAMTQFAAPADILALPAPDARLAYAMGMHHYARAVAQAQRKDRAGFDRELTAIAAIKTSPAMADMVAQGMPAPDLLTLAEHVARGRFAVAYGRYREAAQHYRKAIAIEQRIPYQEPPYWYFPVNQSLGAALYMDRRHADASAAFRAALVQTPDNAWALYGLAQAEEAQGHATEAAAARQAFGRAWQGDPNWLRMKQL